MEIADGDVYYALCEYSIVCCLGFGVLLLGSDVGFSTLFLFHHVPAYSSKDNIEFQLQTCLQAIHKGKSFFKVFKSI